MPTDWTDPEQRREYFRRKGEAYRREHPRVTLTFTKEEFEWLERSAHHFGANEVNPHIRNLALQAAKEGKSGEQETSFVLPPETIKEMVKLLRNVANNINQTARHLNEQALFERRRIVVGNEGSKIILEETFEMIRSLEEKLTSYLP